MATSKNDITGDEIKTNSASDDYRSGWDRIFGKAARKNVETLGDYISHVEKEELQKDSESG